MRLITIDNGNTNPHVGLFLNNKLIKIIPLKDYSPDKDDFILISDVGTPLPITPSFSLKNKRHTKDNPYFFDMPVHYSETLGDDRLYWGYALYKKIQSSQERILAIDAGTFITMDLITSEGFMGGYIYPGIKTFLSSYAKGNLLPNLSEEALIDCELPHSTEEAILGAADQYLLFLLDGMIKKIQPCKIVLTGGNLEALKSIFLKLNLKVPLETDPHSIHLALALIYHCQLQKEVF